MFDLQHKYTVFSKGFSGSKNRVLFLWEHFCKLKSIYLEIGNTNIYLNM